MSQEKIISFELYETIGIERGPIGLESMFHAIDMLNQSKVECLEEAWFDAAYELKHNDHLDFAKFENFGLQIGSRCYNKEQI